MQLETINCIICNSTNYTKFITIKDEFGKNQSLVKCSCNFIYLNPRPTNNDIEKYYSKNYLPFQGTKHSLFFKTIQKINLYWKQKLIKKYNNKPRIIDIGSGDNSFKKYIENSGLECSSYEPFNVIDSDFTKKKFKECENVFDVVTLWHSLEHMHNIDEIISKIKKIISINGYLIIALPNNNSIDSKMFKENWIAYDVPRHLYHFTEDTLSKLLSNYNFEIIKTHRMIQDTIFNIILSLRKISVFSLLLSPIFIVYSIFKILLNKKLSSSLVYICKIK